MGATFPCLGAPCRLPEQPWDGRSVGDLWTMPGCRSGSSGAFGLGGGGGLGAKVTFDHSQAELFECFDQGPEASVIVDETLVVVESIRAQVDVHGLVGRPAAPLVVGPVQAGGLGVTGAVVLAAAVGANGHRSR